MKFDYIVGNPPYQKGLWAKILNRVWDTTNKQMIMVHPLGPFLTKVKPNRVFQEYINKTLDYYSEIYFINPELFKADILEGLSFIFIDKQNKTKNNVIDKVVYQDYREYENMELRLLNIYQRSPEKYERLINYFGELVKKHGSIESIVKQTKKYDKEYTANKLFLATFAIGMIDGMPDHSFHKIFTKNNYNGKTKTHFFFDVKDKEKYFLAKYLETRFAKMAFSLMKYNSHLYNFSFKYVPLIPLDKVWDDEELFEYFDVPSDIRKEVLKLPSKTVLDN